MAVDFLCGSLYNGTILLYFRQEEAPMHAQTKPTVTAILVAAGASRRMGFDKLSHWLPDGRTVLQASVQAFDSHPDVSQIILVAGKNR